MISFTHTIINPRTVVVKLLHIPYPHTASAMVAVDSGVNFFHRAIRTNKIRLNRRIQFRYRVLDSLIAGVFKRSDNKKQQVQSFNNSNNNTNNQIKRR